jgi:hypothetical protein
LCRAFDPKHRSDTTDRNDSFLEQNEITAQSKKAKKLVVLTGSKRSASCQPLDSSQPEARRTMSTPDEQNTQSVPPPTITFPEDGSTTGPATLLLGSGIPGARVQVWNSEHTYSLGAGEVSANGRWAFSIYTAQSQGEHGIQAQQTLEGVASDWSEVRTYKVLLRPPINIPVVMEPKEEAKVDAVPVFRGDVTQPIGIVSIIDLDTDLEIARARVDSEKQWHTQVTQPLPERRYRISAVHNIDGVLSDWGRVRTFTVTTEGKGNGKTWQSSPLTPS